MPSTSNEAKTTTTTAAARGTTAVKEGYINNKDDNDDDESTGTSSTNNNNPFRTTIIRYCGYANEIGESFRYQYPKYVTLSYGIAFGYCLFDTIYCGYQTYSSATGSSNKDESCTLQHTNNNNKNTMNTATTATTTSQTTKTNNNSIVSKVVYTMIDTLVWQTLASVVIPGFTINTIVKCTRYFINSKRISSFVNKIHNNNNNNKHVLFVQQWIPTIIGLVSIPIIIHPIDTTVDYLLDNTIRKNWYD
jgi:mitochondrial fission process protein 1